MFAPVSFTDINKKRRLRFVLGGAGSGKTEVVLAGIQARTKSRVGWDAVGQPPLLLIVPEQQSLTLEHELLTRLAAGSSVHAASQTSVLSFTRLARQVMEEAGWPQQMQLGSAASRWLAWQLLSPTTRRPAETEELADLLGELRQAGAMPGELHELAEEMQGGAPANWADGMEQAFELRTKVAKAAELYARFSSLCETHGIAPLSPLASAAQLFAECTLLAGAELWLDGFADFTGPEWRALDGLLQSRIASLTVTLLLDQRPSNQAQVDPYYPSRATLSRLSATARRHGWEIDETSLADPRRWQGCSEITPRVQLVECSNQRAETDWAAREVALLTRSSADGERGLCFGDISIVVPTLEVYGELLAMRLRDYGIRFFLDQRLSLAQHAVVGYFRSALRLACGQAFRLELAEPEDIYMLLHSGLLSVAGDDGSALFEVENYARERGYRVQAWLQEAPWQVRIVSRLLRPGQHAPSFDAAYTARMDEVRRSLLTHVQALTQALVAESELLVRRLLVLAWEHLLPAEVQARAGADEALQALATLIDELITASGEVEISIPGRSSGAASSMTLAECLALLDQALAQLTAGLPPPTQDAVLVTDIVRGRHGQTRATLLLGMAGDSWPRQPERPGYFAAHERELLHDAWERLGTRPTPFLLPRTYDRYAADAYLALVAQTRPSELLYATRPLADAGGDPLPASPSFDALAARFESVPLRYGQPEQNSLLYARSATDIELVAALSGEDTCFPAGEPRGAHNASLTAIWASAQRHQGNRWAPLPGLASTLVHKNDAHPHLSPTQFETLAQCPFKHFARYSLGLQPRVEDDFGRQQIGSFYHAVLEAAGRELAQWRSPAEPETVAQLVKTILTELEPELEEHFGRTRAQYVRERAELLLAERQDWLTSGHDADGHGSVRIAAVEARLGTAGQLPTRRLATALGEVAVAGRLDRLDVDRQGRAWIVDYKLSGGSFSWRHFFAGANLQMMLYLLALRGQELTTLQGKVELQPQAAYLQPVEPRLAKQEYLGRPTIVPRPAGNVGVATQERLGDGRLAAWALAAAEAIATTLASWLAEGWISPQPLKDRTWTACAHCSYRSVCRFDPQAGHSYRPIRPVDMREVQSQLLAGQEPPVPLPVSPQPPAEPPPATGGTA